MRIRAMIKQGVSVCRFQIWTSNWWMTMGRISRDMMSEANSACEVRRSLKDILKIRKPTLGIGMQRGFFIREILRILMGRQDCIILLIVKRCVFFLPLPLFPSLPTLTPSLLFLFLFYRNSSKSAASNAPHPNSKASSWATPKSSTQQSSACPTRIATEMNFLEHM